MVELPLAHAAPEPDVALVMKPIRAPMTLLMVAEWKVPSSVTGHLASPEMPPSPKKRSVFQTALKLVLVTLSLFALAEPTATAMRRPAVRLASNSLLRVYMRM